MICVMELVLDTVVTACIECIVLWGLESWLEFGLLFVIGLG